MLNLTIAETHRLLSRRMTRFFPLALALLMMLGGVIAYFVAESEDGEIDFVDDVVALGSDGSISVLGPMGFLVPIMAFVIGASYFGADEKTGMIENLLTWEPRRSRLIAARAIGGAISVFLIAALLSAFLVVVLLILSSASGTAAGAGDVAGEVAMACVRSGLTGALFFLIGLGLTVLSNSSIGSIVGFLIYVFIIELAILGPFVPEVSVWAPMTNATGFVDNIAVASIGLRGDGTDHHGPDLAGLILAGWAVLAMTVGYLRFSRRDIS